MISLEQVRTRIQEQGLKWRAGETAVSELTRDEFARMLGSLPEDIEGARLAAAKKAAQEFIPRTLPRRMDWRDADGRSLVTPVRMQGPCGSCTAFAVTAVIEAAARLNFDADPTLDLAEADLFFGCGATCASGATVETILNRARSHGIGLERDLPYEARDQAHRGIEPVYRVRAWQVLQGQAQRKQALVEDGPLIATMRVFEDFRNYKGGVYEYGGGELVGRHAVCVIGYDDDEGCWIIKNSWSTRFGLDGYAKIKYGQCYIDDVNPFYGVTVEQPPSR